jgi:hypothetical protein
MIKSPRNRTKKSDEEFYAPVPISPAGALDRSAAARLLDAFLAGRKAETIKAYRADLEDFQDFVQAPTLDHTAAILMGRGLGEANALALAYRTHLMERELAAITINRRRPRLREARPGFADRPGPSHDKKPRAKMLTVIRVRVTILHSVPFWLNRKSSHRTYTMEPCRRSTKPQVVATGC